MASGCDVRWHAGLRHKFDDDYLAIPSELGPKEERLMFDSSMAERELLTLERH